MRAIRRQGSKFGLRTLGASVLVAFGLVVGAAPVAFGSPVPTPGGHGFASGQATLDAGKRSVRFAQLPPVTPDNPLVSLPSGITLARAQDWLSRVILIRQTALLSLSGSLTSARMIQASDRAQLTALIGAAMARLNSIATGMSGDSTVAAVRRQAQQVMGLTVLNVLEPQVRILVRIDIALGLAAQLSAKESSAAAAIAISRATASSLHSEEALDQTVKSLAQAITNELLAAQSAMLALPGTSVADSAAFTAAKVTLSTANSQLRIANADLRNLVVQLVGR